MEKKDSKIRHWNVFVVVVFSHQLPRVVINFKIIQFFIFIISIRQFVNHADADDYNGSMLSFMHDKNHNNFCHHIDDQEECK